jgi:hypothetical protein
MKGKITNLTLIIPIAAALLCAFSAQFILHHLPPTKDQANTQISNFTEDRTQPKENTKPKEEQSEELDAIYIKGDMLSVAGYSVERSFDPRTKLSSAIIKRGGKVLARFRNGGLGKESTEFGLFPFLGRDSKQLVILQYTGGAHCCWIYKIYELTPRLRSLFDGEDYGIDSIGYTLTPVDIDKDGQYEFTQAVMTFDYFHLSHASSVFPTAVFAYDRRKRKYLPANRRFSDYLLQGIEEDIKNANSVAAKSNPAVIDWGREKYLSAMLKVMTKYIYAGKEAAGWEFFDREYKLNDKAKLRSDIRKALENDPIYQALRLPTTRRRPAR